MIPQQSSFLKAHSVCSGSHTPINRSYLSDTYHQHRNNPQYQGSHQYSTCGSTLHHPKYLKPLPAKNNWSGEFFIPVMCGKQQELPIEYPLYHQWNDPFKNSLRNNGRCCCCASLRWEMFIHPNISENGFALSVYPLCSDIEQHQTLPSNYKLHYKISTKLKKHSSRSPMRHSSESDEKDNQLLNTFNHTWDRKWDTIQYNTDTDTYVSENAPMIDYRTIMEQLPFTIKDLLNNDLYEVNDYHIRMFALEITVDTYFIRIPNKVNIYSGIYGAILYQIEEQLDTKVIELQSAMDNKDKRTVFLENEISKQSSIHSSLVNNNQTLANNISNITQVITDLKNMLIVEQQKTKENQKNAIEQQLVINEKNEEIQELQQHLYNVKLQMSTYASNMQGYAHITSQIQQTHNNNINNNHGPMVSETADEYSKNENINSSLNDIPVHYRATVVQQPSIVDKEEKTQSILNKELVLSSEENFIIDMPALEELQVDDEQVVDEVVVLPIEEREVNSMSVVVPLEITDNDSVIFQHRPVRAWRLDAEQARWRSRGNGQLTIYYNDQNGMARIIFNDEKHNKTRLLQMIGNNKAKIAVDDNNDNSNDDSAIVIPESNCVYWYGNDYTMSQTSPLVGDFKVKMDDVNVAQEFVDKFNQFVDVVNNPLFVDEQISDTQVYDDEREEKDDEIIDWKKAFAPGTFDFGNTNSLFECSANDNKSPLTFNIDINKLKDIESTIANININVDSNSFVDNDNSKGTYEPIIHLDEQTVDTGHENEECISEIKCKSLYVSGKDVSGELIWKTRATATPIFFYKSMNGKIRMIVREHITHKLRLNQWISGACAQLRNPSPLQWKWNAFDATLVNDDNDDECVFSLWGARFYDEIASAEFGKQYQLAIDHNSETSVVDDNIQPAVVEHQVSDDVHVQPTVVMTGAEAIQCANKFVDTSVVPGVEDEFSFKFNVDAAPFVSSFDETVVDTGFTFATAKNESEQEIDVNASLDSINWPSYENNALESFSGVKFQQGFSNSQWGNTSNVDGQQNSTIFGNFGNMQFDFTSAVAGVGDDGNVSVDKVRGSGEDNASKITFKPLVELEEVDVHSGHENEKLLTTFDVKAVYRLGKDVSGQMGWKERASDTVMMFYQSDGGRIRIVVRETKTEKLRLNQFVPVPAVCTLVKHGKDRFVWMANDSTIAEEDEGEGVCYFSARLKDKEESERFMSEFEHYQHNNQLCR